MMVDPLTLTTILLMASTTYFTRVGGYLLLGNRKLSVRTRIVMDAAPGSVMIAVIAPHFAAGRPADLAALALTIFAATRLSLLPTVLIGVTGTGLLRHALGA